MRKLAIILYYTYPLYHPFLNCFLTCKKTKVANSLCKSFQICWTMYFLFPFNSCNFFIATFYPQVWVSKNIWKGARHTKQIFSLDLSYQWFIHAGYILFWGRILSTAIHARIKNLGTSMLLKLKIQDFSLFR